MVRARRQYEIENMADVLLRIMYHHSDDAQKINSSLRRAPNDSMIKSFLI